MDSNDAQPDEMLTPSHEPEPPKTSQLHVPKKPITKDKLKIFLIELAPFIQQEYQLSHDDLNQINNKLKETENSIKESRIPEELKKQFSQIVQISANTRSYHTEPKARATLLTLIETLQSKL